MRNKWKFEESMTNNEQPLDDRDRAILRLLQEDGRLANMELALQINLSPSACLRRVKLLEERGLISRYVMRARRLRGSDPEASGGHRMLSSCRCRRLHGARGLRRFRRFRAHPHRNPDAASRRRARSIDACATHGQENNRTARLIRLLPVQSTRSIPWIKRFARRGCRSCSNHQSMARP
jgi:DNA-binding Lrp family transcriptional regulator